MVQSGWSIEHHQEGICKKFIALQDFPVQEKAERKNGFSYFENYG